MDSEPVRLWRDTFKLNISQSWKADVDKTVTDIELWREVLRGWGYWHKGKWKKKSPAIKVLLDEYERQKFDQQFQASNQRNNEASAVSARGGEGISERSDRSMPSMRSEAPSLYFRTRNLVR